ncbi:nestin [Antennarius striatus]|uniref:nestin n=1 Tax=Antennarius striatus TaxID=241820 RepID=UPI0035AEB58E
MELHRVHAAFHLPGGEKQQMLDLNKRLETYLSRVKLLEEENALLAKEIRGLRRSKQGASMWKKGLEEELQWARTEVDMAWRDRVLTEMDVGRLVEELQALEQQRNMEAQAKAKARMKLEQSRKELEEEQRAQMWLKEKVDQLEQEMTLLVQTHQEDVAHLEAASIYSRTPVPPTSAQRSNQTPNLLQLGQEYSQRATRAWQEAAEAYQGQLARLEESLNQTRGRMTQVGRERSESQLKLQALEKEMASAQDTRLHLERTAALEGQKYQQEIQHLQEHMEGLQVEKEVLGQQIDRLLQENRGLMEVKMSLGLEVATYRALLDGGSLRGDVIIADPALYPRGVKKNYPPQLTINHKTTFRPPVHVLAGTRPTPVQSRKPFTPSEAPKLSNTPACGAAELAKWERSYPKIMQDGAVENFRPQEVLEKVTHAEPLSPPNDQETVPEISEDKMVEYDWIAGVKPPDEGPVVQAVVSYQVESALNTEPALKQQQFTTPNLTPYHVMLTKESFGVSDDSEKEVPFEKDIQESQNPGDAQVDIESTGPEATKEESSDSEAVAIIEPNFESWTSSPASEESVSDKVADFTKDGNILKEEAAEICQERSSFIVGGNGTDVEDKLYPDGEEMDTWDSVIERKDDLKREDGMKKDEDKQQHAEPEEDLSPKEQERERTETRKDSATDALQSDDMMDKQEVDRELRAVLDHATLPYNDGDEEEDSQNVSMSWKTELESDSYAQDNTLADTRPLIRYKSDDTDANTHMDESESSDGEQEKKIGEMGQWSEGKSKRFGTMEDLCEDVEEEALEVEYDLGYTRMEDRPAGYGLTGSEGARMLNDPEPSEEMIKEVSKEHLDEAREELSKTAGSLNVEFDEELETDRVVEQELENLATDIYSVHFAQQQVSLNEKARHQHESVKLTLEEAGETKPESSCVEPEKTTNQEAAQSTATTEQPLEDRCLSDSSLTPTGEGMDEGQEAPERRQEEDECSQSMETELSGFIGLISRPDMEKIENSGLCVTANQENLQNVVSSAEVEEVPPVEQSQEHAIEDVAYCLEVPETTERDVLENPNEDSEIRDQKEDEFTQSDVVDEGGCDDGDPGQPLQVSPDSLPHKDHIFTVKNSTEILQANDNGIHGFICSSVKKDFWLSSSETGATYQSEDEAEQTNQNQGFADNLVWGGLEHQEIVNWNSRIDVDSSKGLNKKKKKQEVHSEAKQVLCRNDAEGELVHSEESDAEAESWSSGEEPV